MNSESIGGTYFRVADADWSDPVDASYAALGNGQRWNPAGVPCLYLNADWQTPNANLRRKIGIHPFRTLIDPATAPLVVEVAIPNGTAVDAFTAQGIAALGLPPTFPLDSKGQTIPHQRCQSIGRTAFTDGMDGIDCRSAAAGGL